MEGSTVRIVPPYSFQVEHFEHDPKTGGLTIVPFASAKRKRLGLVTYIVVTAASDGTTQAYELSAGDDGQLRIAAIKKGAASDDDNTPVTTEGSET